MATDRANLATDRQQAGVPWLATALAALLLGALLVGCVLAGHRALSAGQAETVRMQAALTLTDAVAKVAGVRAGDPAARERELADIEARQPDLVELVFVAGAGGTDEFGISRGATLLAGQAKAGNLAPVLLDHAKNAQAAGEQAVKTGGALDVQRLATQQADGRQVIALPYRAASGSRELAGAAGLLLRPRAPRSAPMWLWLLPFLLAVLVPVILPRAPVPPAASAAMLFGITALAMIAVLPALTGATPPGVTLLASDWLVPHGPWPGEGASGLWWLPIGALALSGALGFVQPGLAEILVAIRRDVAPYLYVGPAMLATGVLVFVPFAVGVGLSFVSKDGTFIGMDNYAEVVRTALDSSSSTHFGRTLGMTLLWTALNVALHVGFGLGLALVLNQPKLRGRAFYRLLLIVPWAVPSYITALTWKWLFNTQYGPINAMLAGVGMAKVDWLGDGVTTNFIANLATNAWLGFPFMMVISLGALQSIPTELYEAADIDGATAWQKFRHVTLPLLRPALFPAIIMGTIWTFNAFNVIYLVSGGGPDHKTDILITEAYYAFRVLNRPGLAAAYSVLIFVVLLGYTVLTSRRTRATEAVNT